MNTSITVKPLVWNRGLAGQYHATIALSTLYSVDEGIDLLFLLHCHYCRRSPRVYASLEQAQAAAQQEWDEFIRAAIEEIKL